VNSRAEEDRLRKEVAALEAERLRLSEAVMAGEAGALEEDERLEKRLVALSRTIARSARSGREQTETLEEAGWELRETAGGKRLWERPGTGHLYPQTVAYWLVEREEEGSGDG
jgi:ribose 1,5-bisphosphokinase PhnN